MLHNIVYENKTIEEAINLGIEKLDKEFDDKNVTNKELIHKYEFKTLIEKAINLVKDKTITSDIDAIKLLGEGWVAEESLAVAIYSVLKYKNSFKDAIVCAINHDGDSDSTGKTAGNIIGAVVGLSNIPEYYISNLELKDLILDLTDDLLTDVPILDNKVIDQEWKDKYIDIKKRRIGNNKYES